MNIDINNIDPKLLEEDDRIVAYLKGRMSAEEELSFLKELENNSELKEKAIAIARLIKGLKEVGSEQDKSIQDVFLASSKQSVEDAAKDATLIEEEPDSLVEGIQYSTSGFDRRMASRGDKDIEYDSEKGIKKLPLLKWLSIAASLICIVWLGLTYYSYRNTTSLGETYGIVFEESTIVRGEDKGEGTSLEVEKKLQELFSKVKENKNIDDAIHELTLYWELSTMDTYNDYTNYYAEIGWNLAIAHLKDNNKKEAKNVLEKLIIVSEEGSAINKKAKELLKKMN